MLAEASLRTSKMIMTELDDGMEGFCSHSAEGRDTPGQQNTYTVVIQSFTYILLQECRIGLVEGGFDGEVSGCGDYLARIVNGSSR